MSPIDNGASVPTNHSPHLRGVFPALLIIFGVAALSFVAAATWREQGPDTSNAEVVRISQVMQWHAGESIAEIGAGNGTMALFAARMVGSQGRVWANEIDPALVAALRQRAAGAGLRNVRVIQGGTASTDLPDNCCDVAFMRWVYHHLDRPSDIDQSLFRAVRPNGLLAVIDFPPTLRHQLKLRVKRFLAIGGPEELRQEGVAPSVVVSDLTAAGFLFDRNVDGWPGRGYCLIFRKNPRGRIAGHSYTAPD